MDRDFSVLVMRLVKFKLVLLFLIVSLSSCYYNVPGRPPGSARFGEEARFSLNSYLDRKEQARFLPSPEVKMLPAPKLIVTPEVRKQLDYFSHKDRKFISLGLKRREKYQKVLTAILEDEGIPSELVNLAFIESGFKIGARSRAGAVGMWQFMKSTAKLYGLEVGFFEDQRKDPILSTIAAARLLRDLYLQYECWYLALAAYNAGGGRVSKAIRKAGTKDFWVLARKGYLKRETCDFVPRFIAVSLIGENPDAYGVS
jgi:membrane-bound lytic murein transglycosylase D